jgi:polyisoprenyl-phosphate glycosyltransferase
MDGGITAGLEFADSDAVVLMTADLQDPPELIPKFIQKWEEGYENVYGIVKSRHGTTALRRFNSRLFYWLFRKLTGNLIPSNASDFRLLDRNVYEQVRQMDERNRFVRGLVAWSGFRSTGIEFEREPRFGGKSKAYSLAVLSLAAKGIMAHSQVPLVIIPVTGGFLFILSIVSLVAFGVEWLTRGVPFSGFGTIISLIVMLFGVVFFFMGIISMYVGLIYDEVKSRPNFIVSEVVGFEKDHKSERSE